MFLDEIRSLRTINDAPNSHIIKIFLYIALNQPKNGIEGFKINKKQLQFDLKLHQTIFFTSLRWLKDNLVVNELKLGDCSDFMINPYIVMNDGDKNARIVEWKRRIKLEDEKIAKNREIQRRRKLKNANK